MLKEKFPERELLLEINLICFMEQNHRKDKAGK